MANLHRKVALSNSLPFRTYLCSWDERVNNTFDNVVMFFERCFDFCSLLFDLGDAARLGAAKTSRRPRREFYQLVRHPAKRRMPHNSDYYKYFTAFPERAKQMVNWSVVLPFVLPFQGEHC